MPARVSVTPSRAPVLRLADRSAPSVAELKDIPASPLLVLPDDLGPKISISQLTRGEVTKGRIVLLMMEFVH